MGNCGYLQDAAEHPLRQYQGRRWIICVLGIKRRKRQPLPPGHYTSLFFLDEATTLAARRRPCAECRRQRLNEFRHHWAAANRDLAGSAAPLTDAIDSTLHRERISDYYYQRDKVKLTYTDQLDHLSDGTFVVLNASAVPYLVCGVRSSPGVLKATAHRSGGRTRRYRCSRRDR